MAKKKQKEKTKEKDRGERFEFKSGLREETSRTIYTLTSLVLSTFFILAAFNKAGVVGTYTYSLFSMLLGIGYFLLPVSLFILSIAFVMSLKRTLASHKLIGGAFFFLSSLGLVSLLLKTPEGAGRGGVIGNLIANPLSSLFDFYATLIFLVTVTIISFIVVFETHINFATLALWRKKETDLEEQETAAIEVPGIVPAVAKEEVVEPEQPEEMPQEEPEERSIFGMPIGKKKASVEIAAIRPSPSNKKYVPPSLSLLESDKGKPGVGDIKANANIIKRTLQNFGVNVEMDEITIGPSVTRYALKPAEGVKLARIVGLNNDLALALAAHPIRIEAPIPGKSLVGIEIPNSTKTTVGLATLLAEAEYNNSDKSLLFSLGKGISGKSHFTNLAKAPHLLVAGATGSGKSVTIHAIITSLLYRNSPENLKFIMVDPKRVELTLYNKIPHLLTPVITDAKKAILALKWAAKEMDRRYDVLEQNSVRDIESYHKNILEPALKNVAGQELTQEEASLLPETMPYMVIIIDELADIMQAYPRELESAIVRLAQMSRAVGIHLILSTQRPSVNVITGLIKANVPSRIALQVTSQIDSRTILDMAGAEKLLGAGDMLFMSGDMSKPVRIQSAFISESELKKVVKYLTDTYADEVPQEINLTGDSDRGSMFESVFNEEGGDDEDDLYEEARDVVLKAGKASTSYLQRKLRIGYARAARLIDMLEERGVIGPGEGAKPREVIDPLRAPAGADTQENI